MIIDEIHSRLSCHEQSCWNWFCVVLFEFNCCLTINIIYHLNFPFLSSKFANNRQTKRPHKPTRRTDNLDVNQLNDNHLCVNFIFHFIALYSFFLSIKILWQISVRARIKRDTNETKLFKLSPKKAKSFFFLLPFFKWNKLFKSTSKSNL